LITPKAIIPPEITTHVATVLQSASVLVKSQIANMHATTQITMQIVKTLNVTVRTTRGSINPRLFTFTLIFGSGGGVSIDDVDGLAYPPRRSKLEFKRLPGV